MDKDTLDELERVAREATPGPWVLKRDAVRSPDMTIIGDFTTCPRGTWEHDAAYLVTFDPPTILSLISAARQQETVISDEVVDAMVLAYETSSDLRSHALRAALALLPWGEGPDREAIARVIDPNLDYPWNTNGQRTALAKADAIIAMLSASPKSSSLSQPSRTTQESPLPTPCDLEERNPDAPPAPTMRTHGWLGPVLHDKVQALIAKGVAPAEIAASVSARSQDGTPGENDQSRDDPNSPLPTSPEVR